jgi:lipoprotein Spr
MVSDFYQELSSIFAHPAAGSPAMVFPLKIPPHNGTLMARNLMAKNWIAALGIIVWLSSCSSMRPVNNKLSSPLRQSSAAQSSNAAEANKDIKFLDDISLEQDASVVRVKKENTSARKPSGTQSAPASTGNRFLNRTASVEKASPVQLKYAVLLNTEVEHISDLKLLEHVDEWYGTPYRLGGSSKKGIDCSAFVQAVYLSAYAMSVPRTAREQYKYSRIVSATELQEGDLVFFNTRGGVSHVGIYLQNNKFIHASSSQGVTVSDLFEPYYLKRYIGAGRIEKPQASSK